MLTPRWLLSIGKENFESAALELYRFQYQNNGLYRQFVNAAAPGLVPQAITEIPFLPISFFKTHTVLTGPAVQALLTFCSSATTGAVRSRHLVKDAAFYQASYINGFVRQYGPVENWCILGLLPSYLQQGDSSLVYMVDGLIKKSGHPQSGFYLDDVDRLAATLKELEIKAQPTLLIGVTYALLQFAETYTMPLRHTMIMETGGMKGRRKELLREEVHGVLKEAFTVSAIHSEYGMTELLSQAYAREAGQFQTPPWMKVLIREEDDPFTLHESKLQHSVTGGINIIDLANVWSCAFLATDDIGKLYGDGRFEVLGRFDSSDVRGCSLLAL